MIGQSYPHFFLFFIQIAMHFLKALGLAHGEMKYNEMFYSNLFYSNIMCLGKQKINISNLLYLWNVNIKNRYDNI